MGDPPPRIVGALRAAGCVWAEDEAAILVEAAGSAGSAGDKDDTVLDDLVRRRIAGEPLEQVVGWARFCGLRVAVAPGVFVPRRRSEPLAWAAVDAARQRGPSPVVVDLCCGSGAIAAVVAAHVPDARIYAADIDDAAVRCAADVLGPRASVHAGDLFDALPAGLRGRVDVLAVNAPYVPTARLATLPAEARLHEAPVALDGGADGVYVHRRVAAAAPAWLAPDGVVLIETSADLAALTREALDGAGLLTDAGVEDGVGVDDENGDDDEDGDDDLGVVVARGISRSRTGFARHGHP